jgi:hypothetical protein
VKGTGIGLVRGDGIRQRPWRQHRDLEAKSGGAHFRVRLPLRQAAQGKTEKLMRHDWLRRAAVTLTLAALGGCGAMNSGTAEARRSSLRLRSGRRRM